MRTLLYTFMLTCFLLKGGHPLVENIRQHAVSSSDSQHYQKKHANADQADTAIEDIDIDFGEETINNSVDNIPEKLISQFPPFSSRSQQYASQLLFLNCSQKCQAKSVCIGNYSSPIYIKQRVLRI